MSGANGYGSGTTTSRHVLLLFLLGAAVLMSGLGLRDPWAPDEPRFALIARDMLISGDWLIPRVGGDLYPDKPPLFMWLVATCTWLTGSLRVGFMLPSMLASLGVLWLVFDLAHRLWDRDTAIAAGLVLLTTLQFPLQAHSAQIDASLCFFTTLSLYGLLRHLLLGPAWGWYLAGWAAAGLGIITKGVGILPLLILLPWLWARRQRWIETPSGPRLLWFAGPLVMLAAIGLWLLPMLLHAWNSLDPDLTAYRDNILMKQTMERYARSWGHIRPPWYFLTNVIPLLWLPTVVLVPWLWPRWRACFRGESTPVFLLLCWILLVLVFFSATPGKRGVYLLPAVPALALAVAPWARSLSTRTGVRTFALIFVGLVTVACAAFALRPPANLIEQAGASAARPAQIVRHLVPLGDDDPGGVPPSARPDRCYRDGGDTDDRLRRGRVPGGKRAALRQQHPACGRGSAGAGRDPGPGALEGAVPAPRQSPAGALRLPAQGRGRGDGGCIGLAGTESGSRAGAAGD